MNKKAQDTATSFGALPTMAQIILVGIVLIIILAFIAKAGEWMGAWEVPWF